MMMKIKYSKELQQKLDEITPKLKFLHCVAAIGRFAYYDKRYEHMIDQLNAMTQAEQQHYADLWESQKFTSTKDFIEWLEKQPYFGDLNYDK